MSWNPPAYGARLLGGPFDGDTGVIPELVRRLWVFPCPEKDCRAGGTHWALRYDDLPDGDRGVAYDLDPESTDGEGFHFYVFGEMVDRLGSELAAAEA